MTDANGNFTATLLTMGTGDTRHQSALTVTALLPGQGIAWTQTANAAAALTNVQLTLLPMATLEGRLVHADGTPAANEEVYVHSLSPRQWARNGSHAAATKNGKAVSRLMAGQQGNNIMLLPLLPADALATLFRAKTDASGKFTLLGVPQATTIALKPAGKLAMASGSVNSFVVEERERQSAGVFVATATARVKVRVTNPITRQPVRQAFVSIANVDMMQNIAMQQQLGGHNGRGFKTDAKGEMTSPELLPGDYIVNVSGCLKKVHVEPGQAIAPIEIAVRQGLLQGRLLDNSGKPVANTEVRIATAVNGGGMFGFTGNGFDGGFSNPVFDQPTFFMDGGSTAVVSNGAGNSFFTDALPSITTRTGPDGRFACPNIPWGSPQVRIWATKGNDLAEWSGPANQISAGFTLKMRRNALVTVSGKLIDPDHRPLTNVTCKALHWLATPRFTWFSTARDVKTDDEGNFTVDGLERGESFSLITFGQQQQFRNNVIMAEDGSVTMNTAPASGAGNAAPAILQAGGVQFALQTLSGKRDLAQQMAAIHPDFESPRFLTCAAGDGQNLGDVMVHPQETPDQVLQSYGGSFGDPNPLPGVVTAPAPGEVQSAKAALARYESAMQAGDINALAELTSRVSLGWSPTRRKFLQQVSLSGRSNTSNTPDTLALKFVPRRAISTLLQMASPEAGVGRLAAEADADHNWVFLTQQASNKNVMLAGILHREEGQWRVVSNPFFNRAEGLQMMDGNALGIGSNKWKLAANPLTPALQESAQQMGERYLQAWRGADRDQMRRLTASSASLPTQNLAQFRHALERRADDGVCPLATDEKIVLEPVSNLTLWDQDWLKHLAGFNNGQFNVEQTQLGLSRTVGDDTSALAALMEDKLPPEKLAPGNDTAFLRYTAQGRNFLMVLTRHNHQWQMLEPALPL